MRVHSFSDLQSTNFKKNAYPQGYPQHLWLMHIFIHRFCGKIQIFINDFSHLLIRRPYAMAEDRLQRMEDKIDRMSQAIVAMARMEERMISASKAKRNSAKAKSQKWVIETTRKTKKQLWKQCVQVLSFMTSPELLDKKEKVGPDDYKNYWPTSSTGFNREEIASALTFCSKVTKGRGIRTLLGEEQAPF